MFRTGRALYAVAMVGFGVLSFGYIDFVNQLQPVPSLTGADHRAFEPSS